jgi:Protein of unknown function (DUF2393)
MGGLIQPTPTLSQPEESRLRPMLIAAGAVIAVLAIVLLVFRAEKKPPQAPPAYAAHMQFSDLKASGAQNFVGATVSYLDGTVTNTGDKTVTHAVLQIVFQDDLGQMAQREETPLRVLRSTGPYDEAVDLSVSPLPPGQSKPFRLTFESISAQWNHAYPEMRVVQVVTK